MDIARRDKILALLFVTGVNAPGHNDVIGLVRQAVYRMTHMCRVRGDGTNWSAYRECIVSLLAEAERIDSDVRPTGFEIHKSFGLSTDTAVNAVNASWHPRVLPPLNKGGGFFITDTRTISHTRHTLFDTYRCTCISQPPSATKNLVHRRRFSNYQLRTTGYRPLADPLNLYFHTR